MPRAKRHTAAAIALTLAACTGGGDPPPSAPVAERLVHYAEMGEKGAVENVPVLDRAFDREHPEVQLTIIEALGSIGAPEAVPVLARAAGMEAFRLRMWAAAALGRIPCAESAMVLERLGRDGSVKVRRAAANALAMIHRPESVAILTELARNEEDETTRNAAIVGLGAIGPPAAAGVPVLIDLSMTESEGLRWDAVDALGKIGSEEAVAALREHLRSSLPEIRGRAAEALAQLDADGALDAILQALAEERHDLPRATMARAAALLGERELSLSILEEVVTMGDALAARAEAAKGLGEWGGRASLRVLEEAQQDPNSQVRSEVVRAIEKIRSREEAS